MDTSIQESFVLPSEGKIYIPEIDPNITLRSMTTLEEKKRLGNSKNQFSLLASIIDDCIVDKKPGFSSYNLTAGDFQYLLFKLRTVTYGNLYKLNLRCPFCGKSFEYVSDLDKLKENRYEKGIEEKLTITLPKNKDVIQLKLMTPRMSDTIQNKANELLEKNKDYEGSPTYIYALMEIIDTVNGERLPEVKKQKYVEKLLMADANYLRNAADSIKLGVETHCVAECSLCKQSFPFLLPFTPEFLGPSNN